MVLGAGKLSGVAGAAQMMPGPVRRNGLVVSVIVADTEKRVIGHEVLGRHGWQSLEALKVVSKGVVLQLAGLPLRYLYRYVRISVTIMLL